MHSGLLLNVGYVREEPPIGKVTIDYFIVVVILEVRRIVTRPILVLEVKINMA
jgi:hypothetical protein